jgi:hypothetical protein
MNSEQFNESLANADPHVKNRWLCIQAFMQRDYQRCVQLARHSLETMTSPVEMRLLLIALQRLGWQDDLNSVSPRLKEAASGVPWEENLLRLILGEVPVEQVIATANNDMQQCEAQFYVAIRLLRENRVEEARSHLLTIMGINFPESYEFLMAATELGDLPPPAKSRRWWEFWRG